MNRIEISGNLVEDLKTTKSGDGKTVLKNKIAVTDSKGTQYEQTYFIPVTVHGKETIKSMKGLKKGSLVKAQGKLVYVNYRDGKEGDWRNYTNVVLFKVEEIKFDSNGNCLNPGGFDAPKMESASLNLKAISDEDIPF